MTIVNLTHFDPYNLPHDHHIYALPSIKNTEKNALSSSNINKSMQEMGYTFVKKVPMLDKQQICIANSVIILDNCVYNFPKTQYDCKIFVKNGAHILYGIIHGLKFICFESKYARAIQTDFAKFIKNKRNTFYKEIATPKSLFEKFECFISNEYINEITKREICAAFKTYISTYAKREEFGVNMNLSIIFCGKPGDGKTYMANAIQDWLKYSLDLPSIGGEIDTFFKAAKVAENFIGVIDDMNLSHFQRNGHHAEFCSQILSEMDRPKTNRVFLLTTNESISKSNIDAAFFRPGRVQNIIEFNSPDDKVKHKFIKDMAHTALSNGLPIDANFLRGIEILLESEDCSLAELFRMKNLIYSDLIINGELGNVARYIEMCKKIEVAEYAEESYLS